MEYEEFVQRMKETWDSDDRHNAWKDYQKGTLFWLGLAIAMFAAVMLFLNPFGTNFDEDGIFSLWVYLLIGIAMVTFNGLRYIRGRRAWHREIRQQYAVRRWLRETYPDHAKRYSSER